MRNSANNSIDVTGFSFDQMQKIFEFMSNGGRIEHVVVGWCYIDGVESEINMLINSRTGYEFFTGNTIEIMIEQIEKENETVVYEYSDYVIDTFRF